VYRVGDKVTQLRNNYEKGVTIHRSQGSEYPAVVIPLTMGSWLTLQRNLLYTGVTRAKKLVVLVGSRRAPAVAVRTKGSGRRHTALDYRLRSAGSLPGARNPRRIPPLYECFLRRQRQSTCTMTLPEVPGIIEASMTITPQPAGRLSFRVLIGAGSGRSSECHLIELLFRPEHVSHELAGAKLNALAGTEITGGSPDFPCHIGLYHTAAHTAA
jgi:UvrD-like helicase C-terminal domain